MVIQGILTTIFLAKLCSMGLMEPLYVLGVAVLVLLLNLLLFFSRRILIAKKVIVGVSIVLSVLFLVGIVVCGKIDKALNAIVSAEEKEIAQMAVMVLNDDEADTLEEIAGYSIGYFENDEATDAIKTDIDATVASPVSYQMQEDIVDMVDGLLEQDTQGIIMNLSYVDLVEDIEGYEDFSDQVKIIYQKEVEVERQAAVDVGDEEVADKDAFVVYVSGIDTFGSVNTKSRSDVNILIAVNTKTGQIQMVNTPRDYYIALSNSYGVKDKLTHAGIYGVDVSMETLEMLYDIDIDYYARINFSGFESLIDSLGGVNVYSEYEFTVGPYHYSKGYNHLDGASALIFARERHSFATGDNQRGKNQMAVIVAIIDKMTSKEMLMNFDEIMRNVSECLQTNMSSDRIYDLVKMQLASDSGWDIDTYSVKGSGMDSTTFTMPKTTTYVMVPNQDTVDEARELFKNILDVK